MNQYPTPEPQRQQQYEPYPYNPYPSQGQHMNNVPAQPYVPQPPPQQRQYNDYTNNTQKTPEPIKSENLGSQIWNGLVRFLGKRGLVVAAGAVLAILAFLLFPYFSNYSGYYFAAETLDDKWWLELVLPVIALAVVIARQIAPRLKQQKRSSSLLIAGTGLLGILIHYWFLNANIGIEDWRFGAWNYLVGMALIAVGGLLSIL